MYHFLFFKLSYLCNTIRKCRSQLNISRSTTTKFHETKLPTQGGVGTNSPTQLSEASTLESTSDDVHGTEPSIQNERLQSFLTPSKQKSEKMDFSKK